ncbi:MAG: ParB/RepB/Spo0J family partition protein [Eubacteriales bacterium]|nr:ParB/RepB/Spo0J family partition protein [Eubacteriales bacterium]
MPYSTTCFGQRRTQLQYLPVDELLPGSVLPRRRFDPESLYELAESITVFGILHPLTVRRRGENYELVAGERRLRAARLAGLREVPCLVLDADMETAGLIAMAENLQREDLDFREESEGLERMIRLFGLSRDSCARKIGCSPEEAERKLQLLRLPPDVLDSLQASGLTEQHAYCLLRLPDAVSQRTALVHFRRAGLAASAAEAYVEHILHPAPPPRPEARGVIKDLRIFLNTLTRGMRLLQKGGVNAQMEQHETEDSLLITIRIPK